MFQQEKKYLSEGINCDDASFIVGPSEMINAVNHRFGTTENGDVGNNESVAAIKLVDVNYVVPILNPGIDIGSTWDQAKNRILYFFQNNYSEETLFCYDVNTGVTYTVIRPGQIAGGLNLSASFRINEMFVVNGILYWTDNLNEPRRINIDAGIRYNHGNYNTSESSYGIGMNQTQLSLIKKPSNSVLSVRKVQSIDIPSIASFTQNFIADNAFQFCVRLIYRDNEYSVLGPWSKLVSYGNIGESTTLNAIEILFSEYIEQDVSFIELIVRFGNFGKAFIVKTWDKVRDLNVFTTGFFTYYFLNDGTGTPIDEALLNKPFESIPLKSKAMTVAKNRLFLGNNLFGYNTPSTTSLSVTLKSFASAGSELGNWYYFKITSLRTGNPGAYQNFAYGIFIDFGGTVKRYGYVKSVDLLFAAYVGVNNISYTTLHAPAAYVPPGILYINDITTRVDTLAELALIIAAREPVFNSYNSFPVSDVTSLFTVINVFSRSTSSSGIRPFKGNSSYRTGIVFYDQYRRKCGVLTNDILKISVPANPAGGNPYNYLLQWALSNSNSVAEIPDWAYYYHIVRSRNLNYLSFIQGTASNAAYVTKDATGSFVFTNSTYANSHYGIGIKIARLINSGIGYSFSEGDFVTVYTGSFATPVTLSVIGQYSDWVILSLSDLGNLSITTPLFFEIYTPYKENVNEGYYEIGEGYAITNPTTNARTYSVLSGTINGDIYGVNRTDSNIGNYVAEAMSPNDRYWKNWYYDIGWFNIVDRIGQQRRETSIAFSNILIPGTRTNGLSSFDVLDIEDVPVECGEINKLVLASKVEDEGSVMLSISKNQTCSVYIGETQVRDNANQTLTTTSGKVIGTINVLKGGFGTQHAESVQEYMGNVYWFDVNRGAIVQYASNGLFPVTNYKFTKYFKRFSKKYLSSGNNKPIVGGIDPVAEEYLLSVPQVEVNNFMPVLPTLLDLNEFNMYDGRAKTFGFGLRRDKFLSTYPYVADLFEYAGLNMFSSVNGLFYKHNDTSLPDNNFYGVQYTTKLMFVANSNPFKVKVFSNIIVEANMAPVHCIFYSVSPYEQITDLVATDFIFKEGKYYANILRDRLSPNTQGDADFKLYHGDKMRGDALMIQLEFATTNKKLQMKAVDIGCHIAEGHTT